MKYNQIRKPSSQKNDRKIFILQEKIGNLLNIAGLLGLLLNLRFRSDLRLPISLPKGIE
jgi:hypothetical protein